MKNSILLIILFLCICIKTNAQRYKGKLYKHKDSIWETHKPILDKTYLLNDNESILYSVFGNDTSDWKYYDEYHYSYVDSTYNVERDHNYFHYGDDYFAEDQNWKNGDKDKGKPVFCGFKEAKVITARRADNGYGKVVVIRSVDNPNFALLYAHLDSYSVKVGQIIKPGDLVGKIGKTAKVGEPYYAHLHLALYKDLDNSAIERLKLGKNPSPQKNEGAATDYAAEFEVAVKISMVDLLPLNAKVFRVSDSTETTEIDKGQEIRFSINQRVNPSKHPELRSYVSFYWSENNNKEIDPAELIRTTSSYYYSGDINSTRSAHFNIPNNVTEGKTYYLKAFVDSQNDHNKSDETNNIVVVPLKIKDSGVFDIRAKVSVNGNPANVTPGGYLSGKAEQIISNNPYTTNIISRMEIWVSNNKFQIHLMKEFPTETLLFLNLMILTLVILP